MRTVLRLWLAGTGICVGGVLIWSFVPVLVPIIGLTAGIGLVAAGMVGLARLIERAKGSAPPAP
ncbi:MAG: hypothetical protein AB7O57_06900 [Hyphomicrobiaceae bacterium]